MLTKDIRKKFIAYFKDRGHLPLPSSPVVPHNDPTLLFTNAGMNQFKNIFLGETGKDYKRAVTCQKCIRAGGKHNDLDNVGHTSRHLTFLEMLGNFSFGDYFKEGAIKFAWEVATEVFGFDPDRLWPTVYRDDREAFEIWTGFVPAEKITLFGEKQNFWSMGDAGPCGPCSELLFDRGERYGKARNPAEDHQEERFWEFWNLVFMQYDRSESGIVPLPAPSIDTGAGLERVAALSQNVPSIYDSDILAALIDKIEALSGLKYNREDETTAAAFRVIADHVRSLSFAIADGAQPSNLERGYVLRKILRRAVRYGRLLGFEEPFLAKVFPALKETMGDDYHELVDAASVIEEILTREEESFFRTLRRGGNILSGIIDRALKEKRRISGGEAFKLKDTYGFPLDEILLLAKDADLEVEIEEYNALEKRAKELSKSSRTVKSGKSASAALVSFAEKNGRSKFVGYSQTESESKILGILKDDKLIPLLEADREALIFLEKTPFYAEKGGQVGDSGIIKGREALFEVSDCREPFEGLIGHVGKLKKGTLRIGDSVSAAIDVARRRKIANNHTATHLLHHALSAILGKHVRQAGSIVEENRLRFDFNHHKALSLVEIREVEDLVNANIRSNDPVKWYELDYDQVLKDRKIKRFFGEKYGRKVRVVDIGYSKELCGGAHASQTGDIGFFRIAKESGIAAGVRRIEAFTGQEATNLCRKEENIILEIASLLKTQTGKLKDGVKRLLEERKRLESEVKKLREIKLKALRRELEEKEIGDIRFLYGIMNLTPDEAQDFLDIIFEKADRQAAMLALREENSCRVFVRISDDLAARGIFANEIVKTVAPIIKGGGGGKKTRAHAGGKAPGKIAEAKNAVEEFLRSKSSAQ